MSDITPLDGRVLWLCRVQAMCNNIWHHTSWWESPTVVQCLQYVTTADIISLDGRVLQLCRLPAMCYNIWNHTARWDSPTVVQSSCNVSQQLTSYLLMGDSYGCAGCQQCVTTSDIIPLDGRVLQLCRVPAVCGVDCQDSRASLLWWDPQIATLGCLFKKKMLSFTCNPFIHLFTTLFVIFLKYVQI